MRNYAKLVSKFFSENNNELKLIFYWLNEIGNFSAGE